MKKPLFVGFIGHSGSGKTTLIEKLITQFRHEGYRVGAIKHDAHRFEIDHPGKDSYRLKHAGAHRVVISSREKLAMVEERDKEATLDEIKSMFNDCDIVFVEGYKLGDIPKIEVHRASTGHEYLVDKGISNVVLIASDERTQRPVEQIDINDTVSIAQFIKRLMNGYGDSSD